MVTLRSIHTLCPYLAVPLIQCAAVNGEHVLASALGTPESFKIDTDASENQRLNIELDVPMLKNEIIQLLAVASGVTSRSGKDFVVLNSMLESGDNARVKLSPENAEFSLRTPVEIDPQSGMVLAVKGFGPEAKIMADQVIKKYQKKGINLVANRSQPLSSDMKIRLGLDKNLLLRFMCRTSYLLSVAMIGDAAIASTSGERYRRAINTTDLNSEMLKQIGIRGTSGDPALHPIQFSNPYHGGHTLACVLMGEMMLTYVALFGVFHASFITPNPVSVVHDNKSLVFYINPSTKECRRSDIFTEFTANRAKSRYSSL